MWWFLKEPFLATYSAMDRATCHLDVFPHLSIDEIFCSFRHPCWSSRAWQIRHRAGDFKLLDDANNA